MIRLTAIAFALALVGCYQESQRPRQSEEPEALAEVEPEQFPDLTSEQKQALDILLKACPGLTTYRDSWALQDVRAFLPDSHQQVIWKMHDSIPNVPGSYYAIGQTCFAEVGGGKRPDRVAVIKRPCVRVCLDQAVDVPTSTAIEIQ